MSRNRHEDAERRLQDELAQEYEVVMDHLEADEAGQELNLEAVDRLLRAAPMLEAPAGFAEKVMVAIASGQVTAPRHRRPRRRFRLPWLILVLVLLLPLTTGAAALSTQGPGTAALGLLVQGAVLWLNDAAWQLAGPLQAISSAVPGPPLVLGLLTALGVNMLALWWLVAYAMAHRQQVVYRVPVRFHS